MVAIDTGTTLIGGPKALVEQVYAGIEGSLAATGDYAGECEARWPRKEAAVLY